MPCLKEFIYIFPLPTTHFCLFVCLFLKRPVAWKIWWMNKLFFFLRIFYLLQIFFKHEKNICSPQFNLMTGWCIHLYHHAAPCELSLSCYDGVIQVTAQVKCKCHQTQPHHSPSIICVYGKAAPDFLICFQLWLIVCFSISWALLGSPSIS